MKRMGTEKILDEDTYECFTFKTLEIRTLKKLGCLDTEVVNFL